MSVKTAITPCLWFDGRAEEAVNFYIAIFPDSKIASLSRYGDAGRGRKGDVMVIGFELDGQNFTAINGGPQFKFTEAISLMVNCETQDEIDRYWAALSAGGHQQRCGWLKDKFGLSWQIVPAALPAMMQDKDPEKSNRVMKALLNMVKLDIAQLKAAYAGS